MLCSHSSINLLLLGYILFFSCFLLALCSFSYRDAFVAISSCVHSSTLFTITEPDQGVQVRQRVLQGPLLFSVTPLDYQSALWNGG